MQANRSSFQAFVAGLAIEMNDPVAKIDKMNAALGITDGHLSGSSLLGESKTYSDGELDRTCPLHWSFAPSSFWSGDSELQLLHSFLLGHMCPGCV